MTDENLNTEEIEKEESLGLNESLDGDDMIEVPEDVTFNFLEDGENPKEEDLESDPEPKNEDPEPRPGEPEPEPEPEKKPKPKPKKKHDRYNDMHRREKEAIERAEKLEKENLELRKKDLERREADLKAQRDQAAADADLEGFAKHNDELMDLKTQQREVTQVRQPEQPHRGQDEQQVHESALAWEKRNPWVVDPNNAELRKEVVKIQNDFLESGYELGDDLYDAIDEEIANRRRFDSVIGNAEPEPTPVRKPNISAPSRDTAQPASSKPKPQQFTAADRAIMKRWGLDPDDAQVRQRYLSNKSKV